jgi:hypothetical protein
MNIETNAATIRRSIRSINTARTKLVDAIQMCSLAVIQHAHVHGDVTLASDLCLAVGNGMKHEALRLYLAEFGPMVPNDDKEAKAAAPMKYSKAKRLEGEDLADMMARAAAKQWHDFKTEKPAEEFSFAADLHRLLAKLEKASQSGYTPTAEEQAVIEAARKVPKPAKKAAAAPAAEYEPTETPAR